MKLLIIDNMLEAARDSKMPNFEGHKMALEGAADCLANQLATHLKINKRRSAAWRDKAFGGLLAAFGPIQQGQKCPKVIDAGDPEGDWE
jgi:hypothetical protein